MDPVSRRLLKELRDYQRESAAHPEILELSPESDHDLTKWKARLAGLPDTPYEGKKADASISAYLIIGFQVVYLIYLFKFHIITRFTHLQFILLLKSAILTYISR